MNQKDIDDRYFVPDRRYSNAFGTSLRSLVFRVKQFIQPLPSNQGPLLQLPQDILLYITQFLSVVDAVALTQVCEGLRLLASVHSFWFIVLKANNQIPLACGPRIKLSDLDTENLRALCLRAARVRSTLNISAPVIKLKHLSAFSLPEGYYFLCPPIPGTSLIVMNNVAPESSHAVLWDFQSRSQVGEAVPTRHPTRKATELREVTGGISFCVWEGEYADTSWLVTSYKLTTLFVRYATKDESASLVRIKSFLVPWYFPVFTYTAAIAHNDEILLVLCPERTIKRFSILVYSLTSDSAEYQTIHTDMEYLGIKNVVTDFVGDELVVFIAEKDHSRVYRYPMSVFTEPLPTKLELPSPTTLPQSRRKSSFYSPVWPRHLISQTHVAEIDIDDESSSLSLQQITTHEHHCIPLRRPYNHHVGMYPSVSKRAFVFCQPSFKQIQLVQYDPEEGVASFHDLELPYGRNHPLAQLFKVERLTWSIVVDDARGEILIVQSQDRAFFRFSYI